MARPLLDVDPATIEAIGEYRDVHGLSQQETAARLGVSRWIVRTRRPGMEKTTVPTRRQGPSAACSWPGCVQTREMGFAVCSYHRKRALGLIEA